MKRKKLHRMLIKAGWSIYPAHRHDKAKNPDFEGVILIIPRHNEINEETAKSILKTAGLLK